MSIVLLALAGVLLGGAFSLRRQSESKVPFVITLVLAVLAAAGGVLWLES